MSQKIYTKTGDEGYTSLIGGTKIPKSDLRIDSYGNVDELNSHIGLLRDSIADTEAKSFLLSVQNHLFIIGSLLACDTTKEIRMNLPALHEDDVLQVEQQIDRMNDALPELQHFILPGGSPLISAIHIARCICRRTERGCVYVKEQGFAVEPLIIKYLNRLSDYMFVLARYTAMQSSIAEIIWKG